MFKLCLFLRGCFSVSWGWRAPIFNAMFSLCSRGATRSWTCAACSDPAAGLQTHFSLRPKGKRLLLEGTRCSFHTDLLFFLFCFCIFGRVAPVERHVLMCTNCKIIIVLAAKVECTGPCFHHSTCRLKRWRGGFCILLVEAKVMRECWVQGPHGTAASETEMQLYLSRKFNNVVLLRRCERDHCTCVLGSLAVMTGLQRAKNTFKMTLKFQNR